MIENSQISYFKALKSTLLLVFLATVAYRLSDQYLTDQIENLVRSPDGINNLLYLWIGLTLLNSILFPLLITLICIFGLKNSSLKPSGLSFSTITLQNFNLFLKNNFELALLENLRSWGKSFLWGLLFIIPGLIKMSYYLLVTYVVSLSPEYAKGEIDALKTSEKLFKKYFFKLSFLFFIFFVLIPSLTSILFDEWLSFKLHFMTALVYAVFESAVVLLFNFFILKYFLNEILETPYTGDHHVTSI